MPYPDLLSQALTRVRNGELPRVDGHRLFAGRGFGSRCALCDSTIGPYDVDYEIAMDEAQEAQAGPLHFHLRCYAVWAEACRGAPRHAAMKVDSQRAPRA